MHICFLTPVLDTFKGGNHIPLLAALPDVRFTVVTSRIKPEDAALPPNVNCEVIAARLGPYYYGCSAYLFGRAVLKKYPTHHEFWRKFDAIHINQTMGPALLRLRNAVMPILFLIHHPVSADLAIAIQESSFFEGLKWRFRYAFLARWQRRFCRELPHVATVSHTAAARIATDYGCDASRMHIVPNGVNAEQFVPADVASPEYDVIAVGSLIHPRKGFSYLADAYRLLGGKGFRIADVGRRSEEQRKILRDIPNVRIFGTVPQEELVNLMRRSAVLISTSLYEGFGLSLIEALACGRPAFAFDAGAVREVLAPIDSSLVVPLRDTSELAVRVERFIRLPSDDRTKLGKKYRDAVERMYGQKMSADRLRELYALMLAENQQVR